MSYTLFGVDAGLFLKRMIHEEKRALTKKDRKMIQGINDISKIIVG